MNRRDSLKLLLAASGSTLFPPLWAAPGAEHATPLVPAFSGLPMGEIKPRGWIREQMTRDLRDGFAGHLDELCREASSGIFTRHRNSGLAANDSNAAKINWWNGETEGNWRAGLIGMAYLAEEKQAMDKAAAFVRQVLDCQDKDGYLGVFAPDLRFGMTGELWTQACLMRGLLDFAELARDVNVHHAVVRAMDLTISVYGRASTPVASGPGGQGMSHDLMICDVAERLYRATGDAKYPRFAQDLYEQLSQTARAADTHPRNLRELDAGWVDHGPNTYETMRVPLWLWMATGNPALGSAARNALEKLARYTGVSGSAVSEEGIFNHKPDPQFTEYEYCATKEIQCSLASALALTGIAAFGDRIEQIWFNAAQGARLADGSAISYLSCDTRLHCDGWTPDGVRPDPQNKFSPTHADVAVCCNPNAANVAPQFVRAMWMRPAAGGLAAVLYGPCVVSTTVAGVRVQIEESTRYPFENQIEFHIQPEREVEFPLLLRDPGWSAGTRVSCAGAQVRREGGYWLITRRWKPGDTVRIEFTAAVREAVAVNGEVALSCGALLFVQSISARKTVLRTYPLKGFEDAWYLPVPGKDEPLALPAATRWRGYGLQATEVAGGNPLRPFDSPLLVLKGTLLRQSDMSEVEAMLVPLGNAPTLRRATFPIAP